MDKPIKHNVKHTDYRAMLSPHKGVDFNGEWPTLVELFNITVKKYPNNKCFECFNPKHICFTYAEAKQKIKEVSYYLLSIGVKKGDKVALSGKNSPEWAIAYLAILFSGATVEPIDITYNNKDMSTLLKFGDAKYLFIDADRIENIDQDGELGLVQKISLEPTELDYKYVLDLTAEKREAELPNEDDIAAILFTSGTTGTPKGVMLSHKNMSSDCYMAQFDMPLYPDDVFYAILPLHHAYTMLAVFMESISCGANLIFGKKLVVPIMLKELRQGKVTMFLGVPLLFNKLIAALMGGVRKKGALTYGLIRFLMGFSGFIKKVFHVNLGKKMFGFLLTKVSLENIRVCISGGGPLSPKTFRLFNELGIDFVQGYGLTEASPITHLNPVSAYIETSVGRVFPETECKVVDPDEFGNGEIYIKGPMIMQGYYKNEEATAEVITPDGFLKTGDVGHIDSKNYLYLTGRSRNIIVTEGGKNVFPEEIEDHFQFFNDVEQICIIGYIINEEDKSEGIRAIIYPSQEAQKNYKDNLQAHFEEIIETVNKELQSYKKITKVTVSDHPLEMTSTKKIKRFVVKKEFENI